MTGEPLHEEPSRRQWVGYWSMIVQQTQNAFNDKMAQFVLIPLGAAVGFSVESSAGVMIALPFVLFAPMAGWVSDRFSKRHVMLGAAVMQLVVLFWICLSVWMKNLPMALCGFFALAVQSAFFGPAKMGINKELVGSKHLGFATGIQQMTAMLAILVGQIVAGWWFDRRLIGLGGGSEVAWAAAIGPLTILAISAVPAVFLAWIIPRVPAQGGPKFTAKLAVSHFTSLKDLWVDRRLRQASFGVAFFWGVASFINLWSLKLAKLLTGGGEGFGTLSSIFMASASLGMAAGFGFASFLLRKRIELGWVPLAGALMTLSAGVIVFLPAGGGMFLAVLAGFAFSSALFLAPLNAWMQDRYPADKRGELQSAVNLQDCLAGITAVAVIVACEWLTKTWQIDAMLGFRGQMVLVTLFCLVATLAIVRVLPSDLLSMVGSVVMKLWYRLRVSHPERMPVSGGVLVLPNHVSFIDSCLLYVSSPRRLRFVMEEHYANRLSVRFFTRLFDTVLIRRDQPLDAIRIVIEALQRGEAVCYFPEGQLSRTGGLSPLQRGFELIARKSGVPVLPVWIDGIWGSVFTYERDRFFTKVPYLSRLHVTVAFGVALESAEVDRRRLREALMVASSEALDLHFSDDRWRTKQISDGGVLGEVFACMGADARRAIWANGHQVRMVNALQYGVPIHVWRQDPMLEELLGLLVGYASFGKARVVIQDDVRAMYGRVWIGGDALREEMKAHPPAVPVTFYDFSTFCDEEMEFDWVDRYPCLAVDGMVVAMSMQQPIEVPVGFDPQLGVKRGARGRVLPGWAVRATADGRVEVYGPAAPHGVTLPKGWVLDEDGFVVKDAGR